jgi:DNA polymerase I
MIYYIGNQEIEDSNITKSSVEQCLEYFSKAKSIQVDIETTGLDCYLHRILSLQIGDKNNQFVIDVRDIDILLFKELLETKLCVIHNAKFEYKFLKHVGIVLEDIWDTMLAEMVLYCGYKDKGYGLAKLVDRYLGIELSKEAQTSFIGMTIEEFTVEQINYAALDVSYLHDIAELQYQELHKYDLLYAVNLENQVVKAFADIEYNGMGFNSRKWLLNSMESEKLLDKIAAEMDQVILNDPILSKHFRPIGILDDIFDYENRLLNVNYASPLQVKEIFKLLGHDVASTGDRELSKLVSTHKFFELLSKYRETAKIVSTYGKGFIDYVHPVTNRIHTSFRQVLNTFRVSSGDKELNLPNVQNIPAEDRFRNCFVPREGYSWLSIDYSAQELRLVADASGEEGFIDVLNSGEDLHCYAGSLMYGKTITKADKAERTAAKTINFGKIYGMGPNKLADTLGIDIKEAERLFKMYAKAFPKLETWIKQQGVQAKKRGYTKVCPPHNGRRWFPDMALAKTMKAEGSGSWKEIKMIEGSTEREASNMPIQGAGAACMKEALVAIREHIKLQNYNAKLVCTVHDQVDIEVIDSQAEQLSKEVCEIMIQCGNKYVTKVDMEVEPTITKVWSK